MKRQAKTSRFDISHPRFQGPDWSIKGTAIEGMVQVIGVGTDHTETVLEPCLTKPSAERYAANYNACCKTGVHAELRPVKLTCLARNSLRKG